MKLKYIFFFLLLFPITSFASVRINEIAWMGTSNSANDEWIELYNTESSSVNLSGWTITAADGAPSIIIEGSIAGNSYFLLERTDDSTVPTVTAGQIYSGALGNDGENLSLKDSAGNEQDSVNNAEGWEAGDNVSKETMQYHESGWITAVGTPGKKNNIKDSANNNEATPPEQSSTNSTDGDNNGESESVNNVFDEEEKITRQFTLNLKVDPVVVAAVPAEFTISVYKDGVRQLRGIHSWNFGDGTLIEGDDGYVKRSDMSFMHTYEYPGTYVAIFEYRTSNFKKEPDIQHRLIINVENHDVAIKNIIPGDSLTLTNKTDKEICLDDWLLVTGSMKYTFPRNTLLLPGNDISFSQQSLGISILNSTTLNLPNGSIASRFIPAFQVKKTIVSTTAVNTHNNKITNSLKNQDITVLPIKENVARVLYSQEDNKSIPGSQLWLYIILSAAIIVVLTGLSYFILVLHNAKAPTSKKGIGADDIIILEDD